MQVSNRFNSIKIPVLAIFFPFLFESCSHQEALISARFNERINDNINKCCYFQNFAICSQDFPESPEGIEIESIFEIIRTRIWRPENKKFELHDDIGMVYLPRDYLVDCPEMEYRPFFLQNSNTSIFSSESMCQDFLREAKALGQSHVFRFEITREYNPSPDFSDLELARSLARGIRNSGCCFSGACNSIHAAIDIERRILHALKGVESNMPIEGVLLIQYLSSVDSFRNGINCIIKKIMEKSTIHLNHIKNSNSVDGMNPLDIDIVQISLAGIEEIADIVPRIMIASQEDYYGIREDLHLLLEEYQVLKTYYRDWSTILINIQIIQSQFQSLIEASELKWSFKSSGADSTLGDRF